MYVPCLGCRELIPDESSLCPVCGRKRISEIAPEPLASAEAPVYKRGNGSLKFLLFVSGGAGLLFASERLKTVPVDDRRTAAPEIEAAPKKQSAPAKPAAAADWTVSGEVYDLLSLKPVGGALLTFTAGASGGALTAQTGDDGRYTLKLPKAGEKYSLRVRHASYDGVYAEDAGLPFREQGLSRRREFCRTFRRSTVLHVPLSPPLEEDAVEHSFVMVPG